MSALKSLISLLKRFRDDLVTISLVLYGLPCDIHIFLLAIVMVLLLGSVFKYSRFFLVKE